MFIGRFGITNGFGSSSENTLLAIAIRVFKPAGGSGNTSATKVWETLSS